MARRCADAGGQVSLALARCGPVRRPYAGTDAEAGLPRPYSTLVVSPLGGGRGQDHWRPFPARRPDVSTRQQQTTDSARVATTPARVA